jgi:hypothetical protein
MVFLSGWLTCSPAFSSEVANWKFFTRCAGSELQGTRCIIYTFLTPSRAHVALSGLAGSAGDNSHSLQPPCTPVIVLLAATSNAFTTVCAIARHSQGLVLSATKQRQQQQQQQLQQ